MGLVMATAFNAPEDLEKLLKPPIEEALNTAVRDPGAWEQDEWWSTRPAT